MPIHTKIMAAQLSALEILSPLVFRVLGCNPGSMTLQGTNTYLIGNGRRRILIDTGEPNVPEYTSNLLDALKQLGNVVVDRIICTHWHYDHVGGITDVLRALNVDGINQNSTPVPPVHKFRRFDQRKEDNDYNYIGDQDILKTDGATLRVIYTPGHTDDHISLYFEEENAIFSGDCILGEGTAVFEDFSTYMQSLEKLEKLKPSIIYPGHGPVIKDGVGTIRHYIQHRLQRERMIVEALQSSDRAMTPNEIVDIVYTNLDSRLVPAAVNNVKHHLSKLEKEGRVVQREDTKWILIAAKL